MADQAIVCKFVGDFEVADNIRRNGDALCKLKAANENRVFSKLIVIEAGSIVEAALGQIIYRAQNYNREGVPNISEEDRLAIAATTVEKFNNIIQTMKKYKILDGMGNGIMTSCTSSGNTGTRCTFRMTWTFRVCPETNGPPFRTTS